MIACAKSGGRSEVWPNHIERGRSQV